MLIDKVIINKAKFLKFYISYKADFYKISLINQYFLQKMILVKNFLNSLIQNY